MCILQSKIINCKFHVKARTYSFPNFKIYCKVICFYSKIPMTLIFKRYRHCLINILFYRCNEIIIIFKNILPNKFHYKQNKLYFSAKTANCSTLHETAFIKRLVFTFLVTWNKVMSVWFFIFLNICMGFLNIITWLW